MLVGAEIVVILKAGVAKWTTELLFFVAIDTPYVPKLGFVSPAT